MTGIQKPNCGNCDSKKCEYPSGNLYCYRLDEMIDPVKTNLCGCFHNPNAREYLMAPVIKELERKRTKAQKEITREFLEQDTYREGIVKMCGEAIILIRDGVK